MGGFGDEQPAATLEQGAGGAFFEGCGDGGHGLIEQRGVGGHVVAVFGLGIEQVAESAHRLGALGGEGAEQLKDLLGLPAPFFLFSVFFPEVCPEEAPATLAGELALDGGTGQQQLAAPAGPRATPAAGFDIVIGNPPYGGTDIKDEVKESLGLRSKDPYGAFIARFLRDGRAPTPLRADGILAYIVSDTFMTIKTHRPLRAQLMGSRVQKVIRVSKDTFSATVNPAILVVQKGGGPGTTAPTADALALAERTGPWCQMVDLTRVSIHAEHDRFLHLLFETAGSYRRADVSSSSAPCRGFTPPPRATPAPRPAPPNKPSPTASAP